MDIKEIKQKVKDLELALNYVCYDATLIPKLNTVCKKLEILQDEINKNVVLPDVVHCSFCGEEAKREECDTEYFHKKGIGCCEQEVTEKDETHYELITPTDCDPE